MSAASSMTQATSPSSGQTNAKTSVGRGLAIGTMLLLVGMLVGRVASVFREVLVAGQFGANYQVDAYVLAITIPSVLAEIVSGGGLTAAIQPFLAEQMQQGGARRAWRSASAIVNTYTVGLFAMVGALLAISPYLMSAWAQGRDGTTLQLVHELLPITASSLVFYALLVVYAGVVNQLRCFWAQAILPLLLTLPMIVAAAFFTPIYGIQALAVAYTVSIGLAAVSMFLIARSHGVTYHFAFRLPPGKGKAFLLLLVPSLLMQVMPLINMMIDRALASTLSEGSLATLAYGTAVNNAVLSLATALAVAVFPQFNDLYLQEGMERVAALLARVSLPLLFLTMPVAALFIGFADPLVHLWLERGAFDPNARHATAMVVQALGLGVPAAATYYVTLRVFWAASDMVTPIVIGFITGVLNVVLDVVLMGPMGHVGIALSTTIVVWCNALAALWLLRRRARMPLGPLARAIGRYALACLPILGIAAVGRFLVPPVDAHFDLLRFALFFVGAGCTYLLIAVLLGWSELVPFLKALSRVGVPVPTVPIAGSGQASLIGWVIQKVGRRG
ncbi:MAG: hypothetical protein EPO21_20535 [Chloroflexota bacterium]|nr:MAG: hypothetical protein EPO21_20535 [Chloroflexota bacterium]